VPTLPVTSHCAIRSAIAVTHILHGTVHTEEFLGAYLQSDLLSAPIYVRAPPKCSDPADTVWTFTRPMYGKADSGRQFFFSTQAKILTIPGLSLRNAFDSVYVSPLHGCLAFYIDDTFTAGTPAFTAHVARLMLAYRTHRHDHGSIAFAGISADANTDGLHCHGRPYCRDLSPLAAPLPANAPLVDAAGLHSLAAELLWIGRQARLDDLRDATALVNCPFPTSADARHANHTIAILNNSPVTLRFPRLSRPPCVSPSTKSTPAPRCNPCPYSGSASSFSSRSPPPASRSSTGPPTAHTAYAAAPLPKSFSP